MWQDIVISVVCVLFGFMLIPQIIDSLKGKTVNPITAGLTALGLYILCVVFLSLELWISAVTESFVGFMWLVLLIMSLKKRRE